MYKIYLLY